MRLVEKLPAPHLLAAALCLGLASSLAVRARSPVAALAALGFAAFALAGPGARLGGLAAALLLAGWWLGSVRLDALDRSVLAEEIGRAGPAVVEVTGPARRSPFAVRVPVRVLRFDGESLGERARLDLPASRAPPQGAILGVLVQVERPHGEEDGFDEAAYLHRQGMHVVLRADSF